MSLVLNYNDLFMKFFELIISQVLRARIFWQETKYLKLEHLHYPQILIFSGYLLKAGGLHILLLKIGHNLVLFLFVRSF